MLTGLAAIGAKDMKIKDYTQARDKACMGTLEDFKAFAAKHNMKAEILEITYHKMRTAIVTLPMQERILSKAWLHDHGYSSLDDGDVPTPTKD